MLSRSFFFGAALMFVSACGLGGSDPGLDTSSGLTAGAMVGATCSAGGECQAFACTCADGTQWTTARYCLNRSCQGASSTCSNACKDHGGGSAATSSSGGSTTTSGSGQTCSAASTCPRYACTCPDGTSWNSAQYCLNNVCQAQAATCTNACKDHGAATTSSVTGCSLSRYSSDYSVSVTLYGSGSSQGSAATDAQGQCASANWTSTFCQGASMSCHTEPAVTYSCTWSKYSSSSASTIKFYGTGVGETAARADAIDSCLRSGAWQGWFCSSGSFSCVRG